jgi:hypothetical protein
MCLLCPSKVGSLKRSFSGRFRWRLKTLRVSSAAMTVATVGRTHAAPHSACPAGVERRDDGKFTTSIYGDVPLRAGT